MFSLNSMYVSSYVISIMLMSSGVYLGTWARDTAYLPRYVRFHSICLYTYYKSSDII